VLALLAALERGGGARRAGAGSTRIGVTGAPGAGKSTLLDALVRRVRRRDETVGIAAGDAAGPLAGGARPGARGRGGAGARGPRGVLRSMAARERLGGLADATWASVEVLAAVFDRVFVETVGVGQSEAEVTDLVDTLVFVAQPGAGDVLQFMKAGVLEHPDVFAVNKADLGPVADRTASELEAGLALGAAPAGGWRRPVLLVSARDGRGIDALLDALDAHRAYLLASGELSARRLRGRTAFVVGSLERRYGSYGIERLGGRDALRARVRGRAAEGGFALIAEIGREIEDALRKGDA